MRAVGPAAPATPAPVALSTGEAAATDQAPVKPDYRDDSAIERQSPFRHTTQWIVAKGLLLLAFIVALGYAAYVLLGENRTPESTPDDQIASSSGGSISPYSTQQTNAMPPAADARTPSPTPRPRVMPQFKDVPDSLRAARASLAQNNLSDAKAATDAALAREADNEDARDLQRDIAAREQRRDTALQSADRCASERAWGCVQRQASDALAIDSSSARAQLLLERAILSTGWTPLTPPKGSQAGAAASGTTAASEPPLPRGASSMRLPSSQDWGASPGGAAALPPLPRTSRGPAGATTSALASASTSAPASALTSAPASVPSAANPGTNTNQPAAAASTTTPASNDNGIDAQERTIRQSGWKHAAPPDATR
ncbi:hypothetical protein QYH69_05630 [Paraburkholderia sp. SARCC-3016]|uniref:hypothetical protein n=1 Tax=Paraburkholderia sp. SARCC-3016 TaxID=3058611 RepID=UPI0028070E18|nr:hypothetical protein [Paraburkholderia sp. SARCC-3016]MDQ7976724.1 hypothetical protein [Paraburkholderia sp. SARCC-3016]